MSGFASIQRTILRQEVDKLPLDVITLDEDSGDEDVIILDTITVDAAANSVDSTQLICVLCSRPVPKLDYEDHLEKKHFGLDDIDIMNANYADVLPKNYYYKANMTQMLAMLPYMEIGDANEMITELTARPWLPETNDETRSIRAASPPEIEVLMETGPGHTPAAAANEDSGVDVCKMCSSMRAKPRVTFVSDDAKRKHAAAHAHFFRDTVDTTGKTNKDLKRLEDKYKDIVFRHCFPQAAKERDMAGQENRDQSSKQPGDK